MSLQKAVDIIREIAINYGFQFFAAVLILIIGWQVSRWVASLVLKLCQGLKLDITLSRFFSGLAKSVVLVFVVIIALSKFGITIAPFIAALGAVVFGSTLALQGPISNYGAGLAIILTRPFVVGDTIRVNNITGIVDEIKLAYTLLSNEDGERITVPNNKIIGEVIFNSHENFIVEQSLTIGFESNPEVAIKTITEQLIKSDKVASDPKPQVGIEQFGDRGIEIGIRYWVPTRRYFQIKYEINNDIYIALKNANITIPYPHQIIKLENQ